MVALMTMTDNKNVINPIFGISASIKERKFYFFIVNVIWGQSQKEQKEQKSYWGKSFIPLVSAKILFIINKTDNR